MNSASELYREFLAAQRPNAIVEEHSLPYQVAYLLASHADETRPDYSDDAGLIGAMCKSREGLRAVQDAQTELVMLQGADVTTSVWKTMVTFRRKLYSRISSPQPSRESTSDWRCRRPEALTGRSQRAELEKWLERAYRATAPG